jgi:putative PEP-CTERM system TPR-repeat lipoprotein
MPSPRSILYRRNRHARAARWSIALAFAMASTAPWAAPEQASRFYEDALQRYEKNDLPGSVLQLKNAIQQDAQLLAAHLLLGKALLRQGELKGAEAAFEQALKLGVSRAEVALPMGQLYLLQGEPRKLLDLVTLPGLPQHLHVEALTLRGTALSMSAQPAQATQAFAQARTLDPKSPLPLIAEAPLLLKSGERDRARATAQKATELAPRNAAAWQALGTVLQALGDAPGALAALDRSITLDDQLAEARIVRASLLFGNGRDADASADLAALKAARQADPRASYLMGLLASRRGDGTAAKGAYAEAAALVDAAPPAWRSGNEQALMTGALAHRALGNTSQAKEYLETLLGRNGRHIAAMTLLASMHLDAREPTRALPLLEAAQRIRPDDPHVAYLMGTIQMGRRNYLRASELFEQAAARQASPEVLRDLGYSQMALGQDKAGLANLEKALAADPRDTSAAVQLAMVYARSGQSAKAVQTAEAIVKADPTNLTMLNFLGNVRGRTGDKAGARQAFEGVLARDPKFRPAGINLSWLDIEEGRFDPARTRLTQMLATRRDDPDVLFQLGMLELRAGRPAEAMRHWLRSTDVQRKDARPGLAMVNQYLVQRQPDKAVEMARTLAAQFPGQIQVTLALARAQMAAGDAAASRSALTEATRLAEFDAGLLVGIGRLQMAAGHFEGADYSVAKALKGRPDDLGALVLQVELAARRKDNAAVDAAMKTLRTRHPQAAATSLTAASLAMARGQAALALSEYRTAMEREPSTATAIALAGAWLATGERAKAVDFLADWSRRRPQDQLALKALAEVQQGAGQFEAARKSFEQVLRAEPNDAATLASLASLQLRLGDAAATATAARAVQLAPGNARTIDLLGWILVQQGQLDAGLRHLRDARLREPGNVETRFHLAVALNKAGRKAEAREELAVVLGAAGRSPLPPDVARLKAELGS